MHRYSSGIGIHIYIGIGIGMFDAKNKEDSLSLKDHIPTVKHGGGNITLQILNILIKFFEKVHSERNNNYANNLMEWLEYGCRIWSIFFFFARKGGIK